jgi:predicted RNase H-related nuclease YkuK (DUF458 family)
MTFNIEEVKHYIRNTSSASKIYIGCDSERFLLNSKWYADYATVVVIHINGKNGAKVFGEVTREFDYDAKLSRPSLRLMNEVTKVASLYFDLKDSIGSKYCELHLDINPNEKYGSSCVVTQAIGYIMGTCGLKPRLKPESFAASIAADRFKTIAA